MTLSRLRYVAGGLLAILAAAAPLPAQQATVVMDSTGKSVQWTEFLGTRTPVAVLIFASWAPGARDTIGELSDLGRACADRGWTLVIVDVQETFDAARRTLSNTGGVQWLHDRHGDVLKRYRVIKVPSIVVIDNGEVVLGRIEARARSVVAWDPDAERE
jgi:hypothetical protein